MNRQELTDAVAEVATKAFNDPANDSDLLRKVAAAYLKDGLIGNGLFFEGFVDSETDDLDSFVEHTVNKADREIGEWGADIVSEYLDIAINKFDPEWKITKDGEVLDKAITYLLGVLSERKKAEEEAASKEEE
ncbi:MAG: hypothetical protein MPJ22_01370 [Pirellulales bacterium]|nr:hypothetical protein [Alphaproteobacteria bacterium]MDA8041061.1 hypothetical protein [Pirellulales bacterium]